MKFEITDHAVERFAERIRPATREEIHALLINADPRQLRKLKKGRKRTVVIGVGGGAFLVGCKRRIFTAVTREMLEASQVADAEALP